jgi:CDP-2,3-bis-(O-geranylgeranyl)-sn-glycerol synthase
LPIVDQVDFVVGALLSSRLIMVISWELALTVLIITPPIHLLTNFIAYKLGLKDNPW